MQSEKKPEAEKPVSFREFARMTGTSDGGVRKAIAKGSIKDGVVDGKILPSIASVEWGKEILHPTPGMPGSKFTIRPVPPGDVFEDEVLITPKTEELEISDEDYDAPIYTGDEDVINDPEDAADFLRGIPEGTTKIEAERLYSVYRARKVKRELQKLEGELVDKGSVYKNLYEFAATMRENFINIPDRVIDNIRASDSRHEAMKILADEINSVLLALAGVGEIKLTTE